MDARPYTLKDLRRAAEERRKAATALTEAARRTHLDLAEIFEARAGLCPVPAESSNVIPLHVKKVRARPALTATDEAAAESPARARRRTARGRSAAAAAARQAERA